MSNARSAVVGVAVAVVLLTVIGMSLSSDPPPQPEPSARSSAAPSNDAEVLAARCSGLMPQGLDAGAVTLVASGVRMFGGLVRAERSPATTGVVLLPQTGGLCGWMPFAAQLARHGAFALLLDLCGYGESVCSKEPQVSDQVDLAAEHLRRELGVTRVVIVGASMGGAQAVRAVAGGAAVSGWANISGPGSWEGEELLDLAPRVTVPGLVVRARRDGLPSEFDDARLLARRTGAVFVPAGGGHGWDLLLGVRGGLTSIGDRVLEFVCGPRRCPG